MEELVRCICCATVRSSSLQFPDASPRIVAGLHFAAFRDPSARLHCDPHTSLAVSDFRNTVLGRLHCHPAFHASCGRQTFAVSSQIQCIERYSQMLMTYSARLLVHSHLGYTKDPSGAPLLALISPCTGCHAQLLLGAVRTGPSTARSSDTLSRPVANCASPVADMVDTSSHI